jgi:hypothetical protein
MRQPMPEDGGLKDSIADIADGVDRRLLGQIDDLANPDFHFKVGQIVVEQRPAGYA